MDEREAMALLTLAKEAGAELRGLDAKTWLQRLESQHAQFRPAVDWFLEYGRGDEALGLVVPVANFWSATGRLEEGRALFDRALAAPATDEALRGRAFFDAGLLAFWQGDDDRARSLHEQSLEIGRRLADPTLIALALSGLARIALREDVEEARELCRQALQATNGTHDKLGRSNALHVLGVAAQMAGDLEEAREMMTERLHLSRALGSFAGVASEAGNLSVVERQLGNLPRAEELALEALEISDRRGDEWAIPYELNALAAIAADRGEMERAATLLGAAEGMMERQGTEWPPDERPHFERTKALLMERMEPTGLRRCWGDGRGTSLPGAVSYALHRAQP